MRKKISTTAYVIGLVLLLIVIFAMVGTRIPALDYQMRLILSGSMEPTISVGSAIFIKPAKTYHVGDVITYQREDETMQTTHRIIAEKNVNQRIEYTVQGDANNVADQRPVYATDIEGKLFFSVPYVGYIIDFIRHPAGFVLLVVVPALWIIYEEVQKIRKETQKHLTKKEEEDDLKT